MVTAYKELDAREHLDGWKYMYVESRRKITEVAAVEN